MVAVEINIIFWINDTNGSSADREKAPSWTLESYLEVQRKLKWKKKEERLLFGSEENEEMKEKGGQ